MEHTRHIDNTKQQRSTMEIGMIILMNEKIVGG